MDDYLEDLRSIRHLVAYASLAYYDGTIFQAYAEGLGLFGNPNLPKARELPTQHLPTARKLSTQHLPTARELSTQHLHVHLGIQDGSSLVMAFSGHNMPWIFEAYTRPSLWYGLISDISTILVYNFTKLDWPGSANVFVHKGFLLAFNDLGPNLIQSTGILLDGKEPQKIEVCGRGFGGAVATLCALWCSLKWPAADITCVTLGSPRVGDEHFARVFKDRRIRCYRLVVDSDLFSSIPGEIPGKYATQFPIQFLHNRREDRDGAWHWQHVGKDILLRRYKANEESPWDRSKVAYVTTPLSATVLWRILDDARRLIDEVEHATIYVGEYGGIWGPYWLLRGLQILWNILWNIPVYSAMVYLVCFQRMLEEEEGGRYQEHQASASEKVEVIGVVGFVFQVVDTTITVIDLWKAANGFGEDVIVIKLRLDLIRARLKSWALDWGLKEGKHMENRRFREFGFLAVRYLLIIQHRLTALDKFEKKFPSLFRTDWVRGSQSSTDRVLRIARVAGPEVSDLELFQREVAAINHGNIVQRWRWARREGKGIEMVNQIQKLLGELEAFFPPPRSDPIAPIVFNQSLSSTDIDSLQALPKLEAANRDDQNARAVSSLAALKMIAANLGQRAARAKDQTLRWRSVTTEAGQLLSLEPCQVGREIARLKSSDLGTVSVLIEWKSVLVSLPQAKKDTLDARIYDLGKMLQAAGKPAKMRTLDCVGIVEKPVSDATDAEYGLVFHIPDGKMAFSLHSRITELGTTPTSLDQRFGWARSLANTVLFLHLASWLHKGIRSDNVFYLAAEASEIDHTEPYLAGFEYSRLDEPSALTEDTDDKLEQNLYRHPNHQGLPVSGHENEKKASRNAFTYQADLYSLGVVLLEIGIWKTAAEIYATRTLRSTADDKESFQAAFLEKIPSLREKMGSIYADVTGRCLRGDFEIKEADGLGNLQESFYMNVVRPLESCTV